jgi:hypothetical protein
MRTPLIRIAAFLACLALAACTATAPKTRKLDADAEPVRNITIAILMGDLANVPNAAPLEMLAYRNEFRHALAKRVPAVFEANGVPVRFVAVQNSVLRAGTRPEALLKKAGTSHVLVLNAKSYSYLKRGEIRQSVGAVNFDADLWDTRTNRVVWKAEPILALVERQPLLRSQHLAGQLLNGLGSEGLITLAHGHAVDLSGERISDYYVGTEDR